MMQGSGELLKASFKNPFDDFNATLISTDKIVEYWCDPFIKNRNELIKLPNFFSQKMPVIIQGSRGSGKTMLFKYYSYDAQKCISREKNMKTVDYIKECGGIGIYFRCEESFINTFKAACIGKDLSEWWDLFSYYMKMYLSESILTILFDLYKSKEIELIRFENILQIKIQKEYPDVDVKSSDFISSLLLLIKNEISNVKKFKDLSAFFDNKYTFEKKFLNCDLYEVLILSIRDSIEQLKSINFTLMVDEYESLPNELQQSFNTMVKYANDLLTLRIGRRTEKNITTATINDTEYLRLNNDYLLIDLDEKSDIKERKDYYYLVAQKRLKSVFDNEDIDIIKMLGSSEDLVCECATIAKGRNEHISRILKMSPDIKNKEVDVICNIIQYPDNPIMEMINALWVIRDNDINKIDVAHKVKEAHKQYINKEKTSGARKYKLDYESKYRYTLTVLLCSIYHKNKMYYSFNTVAHLSNGNTRVFINLCREIIADALYYDPENFHQTYSISPKIQSEAIHKYAGEEFDGICAIIQHGDSIRKLILNLGNMFSEFHKDKKARYPETTQFVINQLELPRNEKDILEMAMRWSLIIKKPSPQRLSLDINKRGDIYYINRIFSPLFNISYRTRGGFNVSISKDEFTAMCSQHSFSPEALNKIKMQKVQVNTDKNSQLDLFSMIGEDDDE